MPAYTTEIKKLVALAAPVVVTQVGAMLMGVVDILMVGHVGVDALAAVSLGRVWIFGTLLFGMGIVLGIDPIMTQAHGSRDVRRLGIALQQGMVLAVLISLPIAAAWLLTEPLLLAVGQDSALSAMARRYVYAQIPSIPAFLLFMALRQYLQDRALMRPAMWVVVVGNGINVLLNWVLIFGHLGLPALGVTGAGLATGFTRIFLFVSLAGVIVAFRLHRGAWVGWSREALRLSGFREVLHHGVPVGIHIGLELWAFQIATLLAGRLGTVPLAAHTVVLNLAALAFMVPLGISQAAVTRVGNLIGEGAREAAQRAAWAALGLGAGVMTVSAILFVVLRHRLPGLYSSDPALLAAAATILPIAGAFQIFDGAQVVGSGILRGMGRTRPAAVFNVIGYYVLALPLAWWLAFARGVGLGGIWWGLCLGLAVVAILLVLWIGHRGPSCVGAPVRDDGDLAAPGGAV